MSGFKFRLESDCCKTDFLSKMFKMVHSRHEIVDVANRLPVGCEAFSAVEISLTTNAWLKIRLQS